MKRVASSAGFTIVESMIVLAVTGVLFIAVSVAWGGKQHVSEYQSALYDMRARIQQSISDVQNGYFPDTSSFSCIDNGTSLSFLATAKRQGTNTGCVFLGKALQFRPQNAQPETIRAYVVAGRAAGKNLTNAVPPADYAAPTLAPYLTEPFTLGADVKTVSIKVAGRAGSYQGLWLLSDLGSYDSDNRLQSGRQAVEIYGMRGILESGPLLADGASSGVALDSSASGNFDPTPITGGAQICFQSQGTKNYGLITVAASGTTTDVRAETVGSCPP